MLIAQVVTYAATAVFLIAVISRFVMLKSLPIHVRWELYPVAHEGKKAKYGGSYFEELEWWTKPRHKSLVGEIRYMVPEILLLAGVWHHNRAHWFRSFPFHFGLYLLCGTIFLLLVGAVVTATGGAVFAGAGGFGSLLHQVTAVVGWAGLGLATVGTLALLGRRLLNVEYREYTKRTDFFNLLLFAAVLGVSIASRLSGDPGFAGVRAFLARAITFDFSPAGAVPGLLVAELAMAAVLIAYIPLTHMSHFFTKWFMYHDIRWADEPNLGDRKIEKRIFAALNQPVSWAAGHIGADGKRNWVDIATTNPAQKSED